MPIARAVQLAKRWSAARRFGMTFLRAASFSLPKTILINGNRVPLSVPDEHAQRMAFIELLLDDGYGLRGLAATGRPIHTILDIGANVGLFGVAARATFPRARIHGYEPNTALRNDLAHQACIADFQYFLEAVGKEAGFVSLDVDAESVLTSTRADPEGATPQIAFREAVSRLGGHVDLVKMDCEGAEWEVFEDREAWKSVDNLTMEYHLRRDQNHDAIKTALSALGFQIASHRPVTNFGLIAATRTHS